MKKIIHLLALSTVFFLLFFVWLPNVSAVEDCARFYEGGQTGGGTAYIACQARNAAANNTINIPVPKGALTDLGTILSAGIKLIIIAAGLIAFVYLLLGGIKWITSGGDKAGVETARNQIIQALIGLIVVLAAWGLIVLVEKATGFCVGV